MSKPATPPNHPIKDTSRIPDRQGPRAPGHSRQPSFIPEQYSSVTHGNYQKIRDLAAALKEMASANGLGLVQGVIADVNDEGNKCLVQFAPPTSAPVDNVKVLIDAYTPIPGEIVWVMKNASDMFILGRTTVGAKDQWMRYSRNFSPVNLYSGNFVELTNGSAKEDVEVIELGFANPLITTLTEEGKIKLGRDGIWKLDVTALYVYHDESELDEDLQQPSITKPFDGSISLASFEDVEDRLLEVLDYAHDHIAYMRRKQAQVGLYAHFGGTSQRMAEAISAQANGDWVTTLSASIYFEAGKNSLVWPEVQCTNSGTYPMQAAVPDIAIQWIAPRQRGTFFDYTPATS